MSLSVQPHRRTENVPAPILRGAQHDFWNASGKRRARQREKLLAYISINERGQVKVLDFGLAKRMPHGTGGEGATQDLRQTQQGQVLGTPSYMSPEQATPFSISSGKG
jgi:hypothetical protein